MGLGVPIGGGSRYQELEADHNNENRGGELVENPQPDQHHAEHPDKGMLEMGDVDVGETRRRDPRQLRENLESHRLLGYFLACALNQACLHFCSSLLLASQLLCPLSVAERTYPATSFGQEPYCP